MQFLKVLSILLIWGVVSCVGCSGGNGVMPSNPSIPDSLSLSSLPVVVSDCDSSGNPIAGQGFLGLFSLSIDKVKVWGELSPLRNSALTDTLEVVDITNFMRIAPCVDCAKLMSIELDGDSNLVLKIGIKHPFGVGDPLKPITGRNRADLHVFNVEGLVVSDGASQTPFPGLAKTIASPFLLNADGYSSYLDEPLEEILTTESNLHP